MKIFGHGQHGEHGRIRKNTEEVRNIRAIRVPKVLIPNSGYIAKCQFSR